MTPTQTSNTKTTKPTDNQSPEAAKPVEAPVKPTDTKSVETSTATANPKAAKKEKAHVISTAFESRTVKKLKLLASLENVSVASIVVASVTRTVNKRLPAALESLKADLDS